MQNLTHVARMSTKPRAIQNNFRLFAELGNNSANVRRDRPSFAWCGPNWAISQECARLRNGCSQRRVMQHTKTLVEHILNDRILTRSGQIAQTWSRSANMWSQVAKSWLKSVDVWSTSSKTQVNVSLSWSISAKSGRNRRDVVEIATTCQTMQIGLKRCYSH